jgi:hypothetical protein
VEAVRRLLFLTIKKRKTIMTIGGTGIQLVGTPCPDGQTFGTSSASLISFYGVAPVAQAATVAALTASTATTTSIATALNSVTLALRNLGIIAAV